MSVVITRVEDIEDEAERKRIKMGFSNKMQKDNVGFKSNNNVSLSGRVKFAKLFAVCPYLFEKNCRLFITNFKSTVSDNTIPMEKVAVVASSTLVQATEITPSENIVRSRL